MAKVPTEPMGEVPYSSVLVDASPDEVEATPLSSPESSGQASGYLPVCDTAEAVSADGPQFRRYSFLLASK
jgi:hypothetical protein